MTEKAKETTASCRLNREERALVQAAAARAGYEFVSRFMRDVLLERTREELGVEELPESEEVARG